jgi:HSP20 family molecular chaperone IbpA
MSLTPGRQSFWIPHTNIFISRLGQLIIQVELSSLRSGDLEITVEEGKLKVAGHRQNSEITNAHTVLVNEISAGPFESVLELPPEFDLNHAKANYLNRVLNIVCPKADSSPLP